MLTGITLAGVISFLTPILSFVLPLVLKVWMDKKSSVDAEQLGRLKQANEANTVAIESLERQAEANAQKPDRASASDRLKGGTV